MRAAPREGQHLLQHRANRAAHPAAEVVRLPGHARHQQQAVGSHHILHILLGPYTSTCSECPSSSALTGVPARRALARLMPTSTSNANSPTFLQWGKPPASVPKAMRTPLAIAMATVG